MLLCFWAFLGGQALAQENFKVIALSISGNDSVATERLTDVMETYSVTYVGEKFGGTAPWFFSSEVFQRDLESIMRLYQREGFLDIHIGPVHLYRYTPTGTVEIDIRIEEGPAVLVDSLSWELIHADTEIAARFDSIRTAASGELRLHPGERFRDDAVRHDAALLATALGNSGYAYASAEYLLSVDRERHTVGVHWTVDPGPKCKFGDIRITGLQRSPEQWVQEKLKFSKGDSYSSTALEKTRLAISRLGPYHIVVVKTETDSLRPAEIPVTIAVEEARRLKLRFGVGYGRDEKLRISADLTLSTFLTGKGRLNLKLQRSDLEPFYAALSYTHPDFITQDLTLIINPFYRNQQEPAYDARRVGSRISLQRDVLWDILSSVTWTLEKVQLDTSSVATFNKQIGLLPEYGKSSIALGLSRVTATPYFDPNDGEYAAVLFSYSGPMIGGKYDYSKLILDLRSYAQPSKGVTIAGRLKLGSTTAIGGSYVPVEERFYSGGAVSVRGWGRYQLGPKDENGIPAGGLSLLEGGIEARLPVRGAFSVATFLDLGNVWIAGWSFPLKSLRYSAGFGVRYSTPIGPLRIDAARPIWDEETDWQFFFSIGHAF